MELFTRSSIHLEDKLLDHDDDVVVFCPAVNKIHPGSFECVRNIDFIINSVLSKNDGIMKLECIHF